MPKQTRVNYGADLLLRSVGDNPSQRQGTLTGFNYDTVPRTRERPLVGAQDVRSYLEWLGQGGGLQNLNALGQGLFGPQGRQTVSDIAHNVQGPVQPLGLGMGGPNEMMGQAMDFLNPMAKVGGILGQTVFHGSPHKFDKFDISKIGTGEGAQVYGHGLYFAENPQVARQYQSDLSSYKLEVDGKPFDNMDPRHNAASLLNEVGGDRELAALKLNRRADANEKFLRDRGEWDFDSATKAMAQRDKASADLLDSGENIVFQKVPAGAFYKVDIPDADIPRMLDWDKPLSDQSESVRQILEKSGVAPAETARKMKQSSFEGKLKLINEVQGKEWSGLGSSMLWDSPMSDVYWRLANKGTASLQQPPSAQAATDMLRGLGIPGIKYYDQGSRGLGQGTRNYVTFGDEGLKILERN